MDLRSTLKMLRGGDLRSRLAAVRDGRAAIRLSTTAAALHTGVLAAVEDGADTVDAVADGVGATDRALLRAFLEVLATAGLVRLAGERVTLTRRARGLLHDEPAAAAYSAFSDFHTGLYRDLGTQLRGGPGRADVTSRAEVIAQLSRMMEPFIDALVTEQVRSRSATRVLDVGCGSGAHLAAMLGAVEGVTGTGIELDPATAELARARLARRGLGDRARILTGDARALLAEVGEPVDVALLANVVYYLPVQDRVALLREVAAVVRPGGALVVVSNARIDDAFSRHFDLLLRAQDGAMELPDLDELAAQLTEAGLRPGRPRRLAYGDPLTAIVADRP